MLVAGILWGGAALREQRASCAGQWSRQGGLTPGRWPGADTPLTRSALVRLTDPVSPTGGVAEGVVRTGTCRGTLVIRWPEGHPARGGTTWVVAGRFLGEGGRGILVAPRVRHVAAGSHARGALRDRHSQAGPR